MVDVIQNLYLQLDDGSDYAEGVDSVGIIYPKAAESKVREQLSKFPPALPLVASHGGADGSTFVSGRSGNKSIHVQGRNGTKSLLVLEQRLDIEVPESDIIIFMNNPSDPSWVVVAPKDGPPMYAFGRPSVLNETESSELTAWHQVKGWLESGGVSVRQEQQYPEGENNFPDFRAWIGNQEYDVEMTSVPDLGKWTIRGNYRDLERKISEVAAQPGESQTEVVDKLHEVLAKKAARVTELFSGHAEKRSMLIVTNWSTYQIFDEAYWSEADVNAFDVVVLIEPDGVHLIK